MAMSRGAIAKGNRWNSNNAMFCMAGFRSHAAAMSRGAIEFPAVAGQSMARKAPEHERGHDKGDRLERKKRPRVLEERVEGSQKQDGEFRMFSDRKAGVDALLEEPAMYRVPEHLVEISEIDAVIGKKSVFPAAGQE